MPFERLLRSVDTFRAKNKTWMNRTNQFFTSSRRNNHPAGDDTKSENALPATVDEYVGYASKCWRASPRLNTELVVYSDPEPLLAAYVAFRRLH
jgi:hypothetical protein